LTGRSINTYNSARNQVKSEKYNWVGNTKIREIRSKYIIHAQV